MIWRPPPCLFHTARMDAPDATPRHTTRPMPPVRKEDAMFTRLTRRHTFVLGLLLMVALVLWNGDRTAQLGIRWGAFQKYTRAGLGELLSHHEWVATATAEAHAQPAPKRTVAAVKKAAR